MGIHLAYWPCAITADMVSLRKRHISHTIAVCMLRLHQAINPFIYGFGNALMRKEGSQIFCTKLTFLNRIICKWSKKQTSDNQLVTTPIEREIISLMDNNDNIESTYVP